jgi:hypothetical protein
MTQSPHGSDMQGTHGGELATLQKGWNNGSRLGSKEGSGTRDCLAREQQHVHVYVHGYGHGYGHGHGDLWEIRRGDHGGSRVVGGGARPWCPLQAHCPASSLQPPDSRTHSLSCMAPQQGTTRRLVAQRTEDSRARVRTRVPWARARAQRRPHAATAGEYGQTRNHHVRQPPLLPSSPPQTCHVNAICDLAIVSRCTRPPRSPSPPPASAAAHSHGHARAVQHQEPDHQAHMSVISTHRQPLGARLTVHSKGSLGALRLSLGRLPCRAPRNQPVRMALHNTWSARALELCGRPLPRPHHPASPVPASSPSLPLPDPDRPLRSQPRDLSEHLRPPRGDVAAGLGRAHRARRNPEFYGHRCKGPARRHRV